VSDAASTRSRIHVRTPTSVIEVILEGNGRTVVLLPSLGRESYDYDDVAEGLALQGYRVLRPQPRGIGGSIGPLDGITLHDLAEDVAAVVHQCADGATVIVGHAFGHYVARLLAADRPELVRGVVVAAAGARHYPDHLRELALKCADSSLPDGERLEYLQNGFFAPGSNAAVWLSGWYPGPAHKQLAAARATDMDEWWAVARQPILDLQAALDPFRPRSTRNELRDRFGDLVTIAEIPDTSHALLVEDPARVVRAIHVWIDTLT
jgi:pimeloyl-ACP methyl ester carboxylesterase